VKLKLKKMNRNLLLISNSTNAGEEYLSWPRKHIKAFLEESKVKRVLFIPYAGVNLSNEGLEASFNAYEERVKKVYNELGFEIYSIHHEDNAAVAVENAEAIAVGGGNTFHLVYMMHKKGVMKAIRKRILEGMPYMGWSAGSNVACPTLRTTNDMPIIEPDCFQCLNVIPFQINPHYLDAHPDGHGGETREQRLAEFTAINPSVYVAGLREGCFFKVKGNHIEHHGERSLRIFKGSEKPFEKNTGDDINFLMKN